MPKERFFVTQSFKEHDILHLEEKEFHHLVNVMRAKVKTKIEVVNGIGQLGEAYVETLEKKRASLVIETVIFENPPVFQVILAQSLPRPNRLDTILEKATELGATEIWLFLSDYSERKEISDTQIERMQNILISAMKQCGRLYLPKIVLKPDLKKWGSLQYPAFFGDMEKKAPSFLESWKKEDGEKEDDKKGIIFFVGPETGFSDKETLVLRDMKAEGVTLNRNILRTDTAAIAALSLICSKL